MVGSKAASTCPCHHSRLAFVLGGELLERKCPPSVNRETSKFVDAFHQLQNAKATVRGTAEGSSTCKWWKHRGVQGTPVCGFYLRCLWLSTLICLSRLGDCKPSGEKGRGGCSLGSVPRWASVSLGQTCPEEGAGPSQAAWGRSWTCILVFTSLRSLRQLALLQSRMLGKLPLPHPTHPPIGV